MPGASRKTEDGGEAAEKKKELEFARTCLILCNNQLRDLTGLYRVLEDKVM